MKKETLTHAATLVALLCAFTPLAYAGVEVGSVRIDDKDVSVMTSGASLRAGEEVKAELRMEDDSELQMGVSGDGRMEIESDRGPEHATGTPRAQEMADDHAETALDRVELHLEMKGTEESSADLFMDVDSAEKVQNDKDLEEYIKYRAKTDLHLKGVDVKDGKVEVEYEQPAKLFGFIGTTVRTRASVDATDNVEISYPWYHIFMKKQVAKESLQSNIARAIAAERKAAKEGIATSTIEAQVSTALGIPNIFEIIADALRDTQVKVD